MSAEDMEQFVGMKVNARLAARTCPGMTDFDFGNDGRSVKWLNGYIERMRTAWTRMSPGPLPPRAPG